MSYRIKLQTTAKTPLIDRRIAAEHKSEIEAASTQ